MVVFVVPPGSGDSLQGAKKGIMEIADIVCINKYDGNFKKPCERLKRQIQSAISLTMSKHMYSDVYTNQSKILWECPVELISAQTDHNINSIWDQSMALREMLGEENLLLARQDKTLK